jgi:hypothetical protein
MTDPEDVRMRAGDTDRQAAVDALTEHFTAGRLTASEYDDRVRQAYASTYLDELPALFADLPAENGGHRGGFGGWGGDEAAWQDPVAGSTGWSGAGQGGSWAGRPDDGGGRGAWNSRGPWNGRGAGYRRAPWGGPARAWSRGPRPRGVALVILAVVALAILTHGFFLFPLLWVGLAVLIFGRRHGGCGRRLPGPRSDP